MVKMIRLIATPVIKTINKLGSQFFDNYKNPLILDLCVMPAIIKPKPKIPPIRKYTDVLKKLLKVFLVEKI
jgi:hypothetical protein